ncbi:hypothetical protein BH11BAC2_BH11BAC2_22740 [soil metagenome]
METLKQHQQMKSVFDEYATIYDATFTHSLNGKYQRNKFYELLKIFLLKEANKSSSTHQFSVLEINCGTGEDAQWLGKKGYTVMATDVSRGMIEKAITKNKDLSNVTCKVCAFEELKTDFKNQQFDLLLSNFGGINCVSPETFSKLISDFHSLLKPDGKLILVIMPPIYIWDWVYFLLKGKLNSAKRRLSKAEITIGNNIQSTYYYSQKDLSKLCNGYFEIKKSAALGQLIPAPYLEKKLSWLFPFLQKAEKVFANILPHDWSDHTYYELHRKS